MINFVAFKTQYDLENSKYDGAWVCFSEKSELIKFFRGWESEVQTLVDVCQKKYFRMNERNPSTLTLLILVCRETDAVGDPYSETFGLFREWECRSSW